VPLETSEQSPVPVRTVLRLVGEWIGRLGRVWVEGQIAELSRRGGTAFLVLRDPIAAVSVRVICTTAVLDATSPPPGEGSRVVIWARPEFNAAKGSFALSATQIRSVGLGDLLARIERLRTALAAEGLFAAERKRPLPFLPRSVGLICGRDSAAERDVRQNGAHRWPAVRFRVEHVAVQGPRASEEVIGALQRLDADPVVDVIIIARGGGSVEDLLPFSDEDLVRAVAGCVTPVVSAIGHEQDVPLLDMVADVRASTPTDAARRAVPDVAEQLDLISQLRGRARRSLAGRLDREGSWLAAITSRPVLASPQREIDQRQGQVQALAERSRLAMTTAVNRAEDEVRHLRARLVALSPAATLRRGYAIVQQSDSSVVLSARQVAAGDPLIVRFASDQLQVTAS
jgi:exodeoxyribonuclease VII large subunit